VLGAETEYSPSRGRAAVRFPGLVGFLGSSSVLSKGSLGFAWSGDFAGSMLREALVVMRSSYKHDEGIVNGRSASDGWKAGGIQSAGNMEHYKCNWDASVLLRHQPNIWSSRAIEKKRERERGEHDDICKFSGSHCAKWWYSE